MAVMIPEKPRNFEPASQEGLMFDALEKLSDDYYVFHSFRITNIKDNIFHESETDFIIFNRKKGIICLEAKAGQVKYSKGVWRYGNGIRMHNGGPFNQASANKYKLMHYFSDKGFSNVLDKCKFLHAVWFPSISDEKLEKMTLPSEADKGLILTSDALTNPEPFLDKVFDLDLTSNVKTDISNTESARLIREVLCPQFDIFPSASFEDNLKKIVFHRLLKEQAGILNYLGEQKTASINGAAGTGKTMIAVEKARRHAQNGEKVLFLCFNSQLKEYLEQNYENNLVSYFTIAGFACKLCNTQEPNYEETELKLEDLYISGQFPYKHIIIDEGQDFGSERIEETNVLKILHDIVTDETIDGSFYVFYDRLQLIQANQMPSFIGDLDCKLTLYKNCRNTQNIATTSMRPITERKPVLFEGAVKGIPAKIHYCETEENVVERLDKTINLLISEGYGDIVILTVKTESQSIIINKVFDGKYMKKIKFTTCRKYKGLEADAVILIDVDKETFDENNVLLYYVGASRARLKLDVITTVSDDDCKEILTTKLKYSSRVRKAKKDFAGALNAIGSLTD